MRLRNPTTESTLKRSTLRGPGQAGAFRRHGELRCCHQVGRRHENPCAHAGRFQLADGGTLFLDEVGEIPLELQSKLLRVLQEGEFERVGDEHTRHVNVRVIAATNRDLGTAAEDGHFRLDLFYRLSVFPLELPPLRNRREDIPQLATHFVKQACTRLHVSEAKLSRREMERLQDYDWPGNVRELQNVVERAVILAQGGPLHFELRSNRKTETATTGKDRARILYGG